MIAEVLATSVCRVELRFSRHIRFPGTSHYLMRNVVIVKKCLGNVNLARERFTPWPIVYG